MKDFSTFIICLFLSFNAIGQSSLSGTVTDKETGEPILFGDVVVYRNGALVTGTQTDFDGNYTLDLETGMYDLVFDYVGYSRTKIKDVLIVDDKEKVVNAEIVSGITYSGCGGYGGYKVPLIEIDGFEKGQTFTSKDIANMPIKN